MVVIINLRDIFTKGKFGNVQIGQTIEEVEEILGKPVGEYNSNQDNPNDLYNIRFLTYDSYEFWFNKYFDESGKYKLSAFQNDSYQYENTFQGCFEKDVKIDTWIFRFGATLKEIEGKLASEKLSYTKYQKYETTFLAFENKSTILFENDENSNALICVGWAFHPK